jgi:hypothetical protein
MSRGWHGFTDKQNILLEIIGIVKTAKTQGHVERGWSGADSINISKLQV